MVSDIKHIILTNMNVEVYIVDHLGSAATDLMGGDSFNSSFLCRSFLNLSEKNENWSTSITKFCYLSQGVHASTCSLMSVANF